MEMTTKKATAKKAASKPEGPTDREKDIGRLLMSHRHPMATALVRQYLGFKHQQAFPTKIDDIDTIKLVVKGYPFLKLKSMRGFCKIWDEVVGRWDRISDLHEAGDVKGLKQFLKELSDPYLGNSITGDYSKSIYG
jgi:hypothetical protein